MNTVTIYKVTCTKAYVASMELGSGWSLSPWGNNTEHYEGYDDGGQAYIIPEGFSVAESQGRTMEFYGPNGEHYALCSKCKRPMITNGHEKITLKRQ